MAIELRVVQFWSEIILVVSNRTRAACSFDFEITCMFSDQIALHSVQLPLLIISSHLALGPPVELGPDYMSRAGSVCRDLGTSVKRNKNQLRDYIENFQPG